MQRTERHESNNFRDADPVGRSIAGESTEGGYAFVSKRAEVDVQGDLPSRSIRPVKAHFMRRLAAFLVDYVGLMWIVTCFGWAFSLIPGLNTSPVWHAVPAQLIVAVLLLTRDYFFEGRGIGKNFFGLQVVDALTGKPVSLLQSVRRNSPLLAPFVVLGVTLWFTQHLPLSAGNEYIGMAVAALGTIYLTVVTPMEIYRIVFRSDGMRLSDVWSNTTIVAAQPCFRNPLSL